MQSAPSPIWTAPTPPPPTVNPPPPIPPPVWCKNPFPPFRTNVWDKKNLGRFFCPKQVRIPTTDVLGGHSWAEWLHNLCLPGFSRADGNERGYITPTCSGITKYSSITPDFTKKNIPYQPAPAPKILPKNPRVGFLARKRVFFHSAYAFIAVSADLGGDVQPIYLIPCSVCSACVIFPKVLCQLWLRHLCAHPSTPSTTSRESQQIRVWHPLQRYLAQSPSSPHNTPYPPTQPT